MFSISGQTKYKQYNISTADEAPLIDTADGTSILVHIMLLVDLHETSFINSVDLSKFRAE